MTDRQRHTSDTTLPHAAHSCCHVPRAHHNLSRQMSAYSAHSRAVIRSAHECTLAASSWRRQPSWPLCADHSKAVKPFLSAASMLACASFTPNLSHHFALWAPQPNAHMATHREASCGQATPQEQAMHARGEEALTHLGREEPGEAGVLAALRRIHQARHAIVAGRLHLGTML